MNADGHDDVDDQYRARHESAAGRRRAASIYGTIITAAVMAAAGDHLSSVALAVAIVVTLIVYWLAEQYAEFLGEQAAGGHLPSRQEVRASLAVSWPMVTASLLPVASLLVARVAGASPSTAADVGLTVTIFLLAGHAWSAGRAAQLTGARLGAVTVVAALLGIVMISLKSVITHI
jgi:hypothetical protein